MGDNYEIMQRSLELAETMHSGIEHIRLSFGQGRFEEMLILLQDVTQAFISIQHALSRGLDETASCPLAAPEEMIQNGLSGLVLAYELEDWDHAIRALEYELIPGFMRWKEELERCYRHHVAS